MAGLSLPQILPRVEDADLEFRKYLNFVLSLMARRARDEVVGSRPFEVTIDPSTICQLECPYCDVGNGGIRRGRALLDPVTHRSFVDALADDMFVAWYFSTGEPLLNRRFAEVVGAIRGRGVFPIVSTNLSLRLSDERIRELLTAGLGVICVSLDGATPETYVRYRVKGDFALVVENMARLLRLRRQLGLEFPLVEWRFLVFRHNQHEIPRARALAEDMGVDLLELVPGSAPADAGEDRVQSAVSADLLPAASGPALDRARARTDTALRRLLGAAGDGHRGVRPELMGTKCDWLYFGATLFPNGSVGPCCVSNHEPDDFGRIDASTTFRDVWNNERFREARAWFVRPVASSLVCTRCPLPPAQDYQFRTTIQALLRNAPEWVLWVLASDLHRFFFDVDFEMSPTELGAMQHGSLGLQPPFEEAIERLARVTTTDATSTERVAWLRARLTAAA